MASTKHRTGRFRAGRPQREPAGGGHGLHVAAWLWALPEYHMPVTSPFALMTGTRAREL